MSKAEELRILIEAAEQTPYYINLKARIEFDNNMIFLVEEAKRKLAEMERSEEDE